MQLDNFFFLVRLNQITSLNLLKKQVVELEDIYIYISENIKTFVKSVFRSSNFRRQRINYKLF